MTRRSRALTWTGTGLCLAGAAGLVVGGLLDVGAADPWASVAGGAAGLVGLALTFYALMAGPAAPAPAAVTVSAGGERSIAAGGDIGTAVTGNGVTAAPAPAPPANPTPPARDVTASGERSIAAGGDIGSASTGDA
ncbi:hypothetical protein ACYF6T_23140 [Streptomyces sp. 7R007]